jgi:hypothetical protein
MKRPENSTATINIRNGINQRNPDFLSPGRNINEASMAATSKYICGGSGNKG